MVKNRIPTGFISSILTVLLLLSNSISVTGQSDNVTIPEFVIDHQTFQTNEMNDLYVQSNSFHQLVDETFSFEKDSMVQYNYDGTTRNAIDLNRGADEEFSDTSSGIMQFLNSTSEFNQLKYERSYYELTDTNNQISNRFLTSGNHYVFSISVSESKPMFLKVLISQVSGSGDISLLLTINAVSPSGQLSTRTIAVTRNVDNFIPFYPGETGNYYLSISTNNNAVLEYLQLNNNPKYQQIDRGISEHLKGRDSSAKYLQVGEDDSNIGLWELNQITYQKEYLSENTVVTLGDLTFYTFSPSTSTVFGSSSLSTFVVGGGTTYIAVVATPSSPDDADVRRAQEKEDISGGLDIEYSITAKRHEIQNLDLDTVIDTKTDSSYSVALSLKIYQFQTDHELFVGLNGTSNDDVTFYPLDSDSASIVLDPVDNDILNSLTDDAVLIPAGSYYVVLSSDEKYQITTMKPTEFAANTVVSPTQSIDQPMLYSLSNPNEFYYDYFNITYLDEQNQTADYRFTLYDANGNYLDFDTFTVAHYYDNGTGDYIIANDSASISPYNTNQRNIEGLYLRVDVLSNGEYNSSGYLSESDVQTISTTINIHRSNMIQVLEDDNSDYDYQFHELTLSNVISRQLHSYNSTSADFIIFNTDPNKAYRITFDSINRTVGTTVYVTNQIDWGYYESNSAINISGQDHYTFDLQFATTEILKIGLYVEYGTGPFNGSSIISVEELDILNIDSPDFSILEPTTSPSLVVQYLTNPWLWVGVSGIAIIVTVVELIRRGKINLSLSK